MRNKRVFIGWSGKDNQEIATKLSCSLAENGYSSIIGGQWRNSFTVSEEIIHQMNGCDFAIFLIEKEIRRNDKEEIISMGFNPNVMMELGYMLHKISDPNCIRRILINVLPHELPSDLQGTWTDEVKKDSYDADDPKAKDKALSKVATEIADKFLDYIKTFKPTDKLDYFDEWEENKLDIFDYKGDVRIADKLIFGMQAAIYTGEFDELYRVLKNIKDDLSKLDRFKDYGAVACAMALLKVFVYSRRLSRPLTDSQFAELCEDLETVYEKDIPDADVRNWCEIFRTDKLELCYELYAGIQKDKTDKIELYYYALKLCHKILEKIEFQINSEVKDDGTGKKDENYALLYKAFANRNISQIHKNLIELEPEKADEHLSQQKKYCNETFLNRKSLYNFYKSTSRENSRAMDLISQEYYIALVEQHEFEESIVERKKIQQIAKTIHNKLQDRAKVQNMILEAVKAKNTGFLD
ncbi:MAG: nucleotide-binding protein [Acutalibacteraceae bacterium]|nr:nucleotide-binding protein [Acutalibacteraceae bacterium]